MSRLIRSPGQCSAVNMAVAAAAVLSCAAASFDVSLLNPCESPALPAGAIHIVIAGFKENTCFTHYLWDMGLTNAHVFVYRRMKPENALRSWHGPCGMLVQERLLLPNHGRDIAAFHSHVVEHYADPPLSLVFLHGHGSDDERHTDCPTIIGHARLAYRGLARASEGAAAFAQHMVTLTRLGRSGDPPWLMDFTESTLSRKLLRQEHPPSAGNAQAAGRLGSRASHERLVIHNHERLTAGLVMEQEKQTGSTLSSQPSSQEQSKQSTAEASCAPIFTKWGVNTTSAGFHTCCASFILPWDRIERYPRGFYTEALQHALDTRYDDAWTSRVCWEFIVWRWFQEPGLSPAMKAWYLKAADVTQDLDLSRCASRLGQDSSIEDC